MPSPSDLHSAASAGVGEASHVKMEKRGIRMKKMRLLIIVFALVLSLIIVSQGKTTHAESLEEIEAQLADLTQQMQLSVAATTPLEAEVTKLNDQIASIQSQIKAKEESVRVLEAGIAEREGKIKIQYRILASKVRDYYKKSRMFSPLLILVSSQSAGDLTRGLTYKSVSTDEDKNLIVSITTDIIQLEEDKVQVEQDRAGLAVLQEKLDSQRAFFAKEISGAKKWQAELSGKIADLNARQQEIINARSGSFTFTLGGGELADEFLSSAKGFQESAPSGYFAIFSFGGYSHRKGMSQYGARGRAESGKLYGEILEAYYGKKPVKKDDTGGSIKVSGNGELEFENLYLYGIAEMPGTWHIEALKTQAVAARTYAYRYKRDGTEICTSQSCQVFDYCKATGKKLDGSTDAKCQQKYDVSGSWRSAVDQTRGEILEDVVTYYSSTSGGFLRTTGWDTTDGSGGGSFIDKSYERLGNSPWIEKSWWREGYTNSGNTCGRANPWLSPEEMADIVNAAVALRTDGIDTSRITPVTTSCWGGNPYSMEELRNLVSGKGGISSASSVSITQGNGVTNSLSIGGVDINPSDFRQAFNLRAPGYLRIPQYPGTYGDPFINVVKK